MNCTNIVNHNPSLGVHRGFEHDDNGDVGDDDDWTPSGFTGGKHDDQHPQEFTNVFDHDS